MSICEVLYLAGSLTEIKYFIWHLGPAEWLAAESSAENDAVDVGSGACATLPLS